MLCRATQDGWVMESSDKMWFTEEVNGNPLQYSCLGNPMDKSPRNCKELDTTEQLSPYQLFSGKNHPNPFENGLTNTLEPVLYCCALFYFKKGKKRKTETGKFPS